MSRRKYEGKTIQEKRRTDKDPAKFAPAKKERVYKLRITYTKRYVVVENAVSPAAREQKRKLIEKRIRENRYWGLWRNGDMIDGPHFEEYEE